MTKTLEQWAALVSAARARLNTAAVNLYLSDADAADVDRAAWPHQLRTTPGGPEQLGGLPLHRRNETANERGSYVAGQCGVRVEFLEPPDIIPLLLALAETLERFPGALIEAGREGSVYVRWRNEYVVLDEEPITPETLRREAV